MRNMGWPILSQVYKDFLELGGDRCSIAVRAVPPAAVKRRAMRKYAPTMCHQLGILTNAPPGADAGTGCGLS